LNLHSNMTINQAASRYIESVAMSRAESTARTYANGLGIFLDTLGDLGIDPESEPVAGLTEDQFSDFIRNLYHLAPSTERVYIDATTGFFEYVTAERMATPNLARLRLLKKQRSRRVGQRLPNFPKTEIENILEAIQDLDPPPAVANLKSLHTRLRALRDKALLLTLADTGLRAAEACNLQIVDIDFETGRAIVIGKGDKQAVIRFSTRSLKAIREYLDDRKPLDDLFLSIGEKRRDPRRLPVFAHHNLTASLMVRKITTRNLGHIVNDWVVKILGQDWTEEIHPHSFRHYFVTRILEQSDNLVLAQRLARHANIQTTQRYAHISSRQLDLKYQEIFGGV
jgi:integrase/recombinase XerC